MKHLILIFALFFTITNAYANKKSINKCTVNTEIKNPNIDIKLTPEQVKDMTIYELESLLLKFIPEVYEEDCTITVTVSGEINVKGIGKVGVSITVTGSCDEARDIALSVLKQLKGLME